MVDDLSVAGSIPAAQGGREVERSTEEFHIAIFGTVGSEELCQEVVLGIVDGVAEELRESELRIGGGGRNGGRRGTLDVGEESEDGREGS